jgi:hypothetical protein
MRHKILWSGLALALLLGGPVVAEEVVYFSNGTTMAILDHTVEEGMVHVRLGVDSSIAFPAASVDRITKAGKDVFVGSEIEGGAHKNKMVQGSTQTSPVLDTRVTGRPMSHQIRGRWIGNEVENNPHVVRDPRTGLAAYRPFPNNEHPGLAARQATGRLDMLNVPPPAGVAKDPKNGGVVGARPFGRGYIAKMPQDTGIRRPMLTKPTVRPEAPSKNNSSQSGSGTDGKQ